MPKKIALISALAFLAIILIFAAARVYLVKRSPPATISPASPDLISFSLKSPQSKVNVGDKVSLNLFLTGKDAGHVSGFDIKVNYDKTKLRLDKAEKGTFFNNYLVVKWDLDKAWFAATINPSEANIAPQITSPFLLLEFTAISKSDSTPVSMSSDSMVVYSTSNAGSYPKGNIISLSIK